MAESPKQPDPSTSKRFSLDTWAVLLGLALAALVRLGLIKHIPW